LIRPHCVLLVFRKDWLEIRRNRAVLFPLIVVPLIFAVMLPIVAVTPTMPFQTQVSSQGLLPVLKPFPDQVKGEIAAMSGQQAIVFFMLLYLFAPVFLMIPIMASSIIASDSFAGEKERKTIEGLLATPLSDSEMLLGKMLVSFVLAFIATTASFALYSAVTDYLTIGIFGGKMLLPNELWLTLIFLLAPALAFADIGVTVLISARVKGVKEAQQISALFLIPLIATVLGQTSGSMAFDPPLVTLMISILAVSDIIIFVTAVKTFGRNQILTRLS